MTKNKFYKKLAEYEDYNIYKGSLGRPLKKITREDLWNYVSQPLEAEVSQENGGQWINSEERLPKKYEPVITYDPTEERERDKYLIDFIYVDPNGGLHWDWYHDKQVYWKEFSRFSG